MAVNDSMAGDSGRVELAFDVAKLWVLNGDKQYWTDVQAGHKPPAYLFGGFGASVEEVDPLAEAYAVAAPKSWTKIERPKSTRGGRNGNRPNDEDDGRPKMFEAYVTRSIWFAPAARRQAWMEKDKKAGTFTLYPNYAQGRSMRLNLLGLAGYKVKDANGGPAKFTPFVPVILTASGWQAGWLGDALFKTWKKQSAKARRAVSEDFANNPWYFWLPLGTFGDKPHFETKGSGSESHDLTPLSIQMPTDLTADYLQSIYVGEEVRSRLDEMADLAKDWRAEWDEATLAVNGERNEETGPDSEVKPIPNVAQPTASKQPAAGAASANPWDDEGEEGL